MRGVLQMNLEFKWELVEREPDELGGAYSRTDRAKVIGGWLVRHYWQTSGASSLVFIPDQYHSWTIDA